MKKPVVRVTRRLVQQDDENSSQENDIALGMLKAGSLATWFMMVITFALILFAVCGPHR
jgi:hypothetical protein